ncbi:MAG: hypothetical protein ACHQ4J_02950 [Candidatus Binatia bacterium]
MPGPRERKRVLIVVRTYPTPATKGVEVSCTAGITDAGQWIRLFPVPYRFLDQDKRFRKYQWVNVGVFKASDLRLESYTLIRDSIEIVSEPLSTDHAWKARWQVIRPLVAHCLCCLERERDSNGFPTLGLFRPKKIERLLIELAAPSWTKEEREILGQSSFIDNAPETELEKVPFTFKYQFACDHQECSGHTLMCTDWEMGQSWRRWRDKYGPKWEGKFRQRYEAEMIGKYDTHFYVGTVKGHPGSWIIVGLFYPPLPQAPVQKSLFPIP